MNTTKQIQTEILNTVQYGNIDMNSLLDTINRNRDQKTAYFVSRGYTHSGVADENITLKEYKGFKLGDEVTILKKPESWDPSAGAYPYDKLQVGQTKYITKYPYVGKIDSLTTFFISNDGGKYKLIKLGGVGIGVNGFGFSLDELIDLKLIKSKHVDLGDPSTLSEGDSDTLDLKDLVIGHSYKIKSLEWIKSNKNKCKISRNWGNQTVYLNEIVNGNKLVLDKDPELKRKDYLFGVDISAIKNVSNQTKISQTVKKLLGKLKEEKLIYGYDGGPGGGRSNLIKTKMILPGINDMIYIPVDDLKRMWSVDQINELFDKGETKQGFQATKYSYISTELSLIKDKNKLPKTSEWSTMRD
jgi:hypothetical protein